jgi:phosphate transport system permease protein
MAPATDHSPGMAWQQSQLSRTLDKTFRWLTTAFAVGVGVLLIAIAFQVGLQAIPAIQKFGIGFLSSTRWNPVEEIFGAWTQIYGTLVTSFMALLIAIPIGVGVAIVLSEDFLPPKVQKPLVFMVELLAAIPSVIYGLWGIFVLVPLMQGPMMWIFNTFKWIPLFSTPPTGRGVYIAGIILAIMIAAISRDALVGVDPQLRQAAYGLGATRWETLFQVIVPSAISGIIGGVMLALGRAMGETMAVTMLIGNSSAPSPSIFAQGSTISSLLANQFAEADGMQVSSLMYAALVLFGLTLIVNVLAQLLVSKVELKKIS